MGYPAASSAAGGGGGGGAGGRDPDAAWRKEFDVAWSQTNAERSALRSEYAAVKDTTIRELKDDPALGRFDAAMDRIEKLHEKVQRPLEQLADGEALLNLSHVLVSSAKVENRDGPTPSEFLTALLRKFGVTPTPLHDSSESISLSSLGDAVSPLFMSATGCQTMNGPMDLTIKEKEPRHVVRRQSGRLDSKPTKPDELAPDQVESNDTDKNASVMFNVLCTNPMRRVKLEHLVLNRRSFAQTVENIFALSFLVKDGRAEIRVDGSRDHFVAPRNAPAATLIDSRKVVNSQFVFRFDTKDWQVMRRIVKPGEELTPDRNSYCGGEYKNTQSSSGSGCSQLSSDSNHLKEDVAKEDPIEFTNDEAMKENLTTWCPGYDTQRKRKRQHVSRRLFSADD
ncbi:unnamed protein product [Urochloa decumbens]|uniref:Non-structural maintenance of chromosomes element 4 n=1 Tax=Urochloa decumbens TaxID=240449 RepID=A0ABC9BIZ6_9POAL